MLNKNLEAVFSNYGGNTAELDRRVKRLVEIHCRDRKIRLQSVADRESSIRAYIAYHVNSFKFRYAESRLHFLSIKFKDWMKIVEVRSRGK